MNKIFKNFSRLLTLLCGWLLFMSSFSFAASDSFVVNGVAQGSGVSGGVSGLTNGVAQGQTDNLAITNGGNQFYATLSNVATGTPIYTQSAEADTLQTVVDRGFYSSQSLLSLYSTNSLGSLAYPWQDIFVSTSSVYFGTSTKLTKSSSGLSLRNDSYVSVVTNSTFLSDINGWYNTPDCINWESSDLGARLTAANLCGGFIGQTGTGADYPNASDTFKISFTYTFTNFAANAYIHFTFDNGTHFSPNLYFDRTGGVFTFVSSFNVSGTAFEFEYITSETTNEQTRIFIKNLTVERLSTNSIVTIGTTNSSFLVNGSMLVDGSSNLYDNGNSVQATNSMRKNTQRAPGATTYTATAQQIYTNSGTRLTLEGNYEMINAVASQPIIEFWKGEASPTLFVHRASAPLGVAGSNDVPFVCFIPPNWTFQWKTNNTTGSATARIGANVVKTQE